MEELITVAEAAVLADVAISTIYRWLQGGVLSRKYFPDGRQAIVREELTKVGVGAQNRTLYELFMAIGRALNQAVALLPEVEQQFGPGWETVVWPAEEWEKVRQKAFTQAEAHGDMPAAPARGRPARSEVAAREAIARHVREARGPMRRGLD
jgi:hypothetical protein